jgi:RecA-family ATPase
MDDPTFTTYTPISVRDLMALRIAEPEWLVEGVAVAGSAILLSGREKSGKGWVCIDLACSIVLGEPFLGRAVLEGPCIYLALEESTRTLRDRLRLRLGSRWDVPLYVVPLDGSTGESFSLEDPRSITALINLIEEVQPVAIFLDTLREAHSGREDSSDDMTPLLRPIRQITHQFDVTLIVTHHQSKMAGASRGSTAIRAAFDDEIAFTRTDEQQERDIRGTLKIEGRNVPKEVIYVVFDPDKARWATVNEPEVIVEPQLRERILMVLDHANAWLTAKEIAERLPGTKLKTIQNKIAEMLQERPLPMAMSGEPRKGSPRRFASLNRRFEFAPEDSGNDAGNEGNVDRSAA